MIFQITIIIFVFIDYINKEDSYELKFLKIEVSNIIKTIINF